MGSFETLVVVSVLLPHGREELLPVSSAFLPCSGVNHHWHPLYLAEWFTGDNMVEAMHVAQQNSLGHSQATLLEGQLDTKSTCGLPVTISFYHHSKPEPPNSFWVMPEPATVLQIQ